MKVSRSRFEQLIEEALAHDFSGWDFSWLRGRWEEAEPSWNYRQLVLERLEQVDALLDMGTGGGEFLASLGRLPDITWATESYPPNIPIARQRLAPLGVRVVAFTDDAALPLPDATFQLVINRHESYDPAEIYRVLRPGGTFLTQQVGSTDCIQLNQFLGAPGGPEGSWQLDTEARRLEEAGLRVVRRAEEFLDSVFYDIGAVVFYLKVINWQIPDFSVEKYHERLLAMHALIEREGAFRAKAHRCLIEAVKR